MRTKNKIQGIYVLLLACSILLSGSKNVQAQCNADFDYFNSHCNYNITYFADLSTSGSGQIISWLWDFGDGGTSSIPDPLHFYAGPGTYSVSLIIETNLACFDTTTYDVVISEHLEAAFTDSITCHNTAYFSDLSITGPDHTIISWSWDFGDGYTSTLQNPSHTYTVPGTYTATLIVEADLGCIDTARHDIFIHEIPEANFTADTACCGTPTQFTDLSIPGEGNTIMGWGWEFGDGGFSSFQNPTYTYLDPGIYMVHLTIFSDCGCMDTVYHEVVAEDHAKVEEGEISNAQLIIYPNPLKDVAEISFKLTHPASVNVDVINTSGTIVARITDEQYQSGTHQLRWNSEDLTAGLYILKMMVGDKMYTSKLVKSP